MWGCGEAQMKYLFFVLGLLFGPVSQAEVKSRIFYPKDSAKFDEENDAISYHSDVEKFGKTTMLIETTSPMGVFDFVFTKKQRMLTKDFPVYDLYAFVYLHDHGGTLLKVRFQVFGDALYEPSFVYEGCFVSDADKDGDPEFYLTYLGSSDGLDEKPLSQIVYTRASTGSTTFVKSKATAFYPAGNPNDSYHEVFDANWKKLPKAIRLKSKQILKAYRAKNGDEFRF